MSSTVALLLVERLLLILTPIPFTLPRHLLLLLLPMLVLPYRAAQNSHIKRLFYACVCVRVCACVRVSVCDTHEGWSNLVATAARGSVGGGAATKFTLKNDLYASAA